MRVDIIGLTKTYAFVHTTSGGSFFYGTAFGFAILFPTSKDKAYVDSSDTIISSALNIDEERACNHRKLSGTLLALPKEICTTRDIAGKIYADDVTTARVTENSLKINGQWNRFAGPIFHWDSFSGYFRRYPDNLETFPYVRNLSVSITRDGNTVTQVISAEWTKYNVPNPKFYSAVQTSVIIFDPVNHTKLYLGKTTKLPSLDLPSKTPDAFSVRSLPRNLRDWDAIFGVLQWAYKPTKDDLIFGDLVRRCANDAVVIPTNSIELLMELRVLTESLKAAYDLTKGKVNANKIASAYLQYKYGLRLTAHDLTIVAKGISKRLLETSRDKSRSRAMEVVFPEPRNDNGRVLEVKYTYKINYRSHSRGWEEGVRQWFNSGLFPSLTNAWDLIPLSFVLDWFFKIESHLNAIDSNTYWSVHEISSVVFTKKMTYHDVAWLFNDDQAWTLTGDVRAVKYDRQLSSTVHKPTFFDPTPRNFKNYAELAALSVVLK